MKKNIYTSLFVIALTILFLINPVYAKVLTLRVGHDIPPFAAPAKGVDRWAKLVNQNAEGRINVEVYPASSLCDQKSSIDSMEAGAVDAYLINFSTHRSLFPLLSVESLPGLAFPDTVTGHTDHGETVISMAQKYPSIAKELKDYQIILFIVSPSSVLVSSGKRIRVPDDIVGIKVGGHGVRLELLKIIGAAPVFDIITQSYQKLQTGVLDATTINFQAIGEFKLYEVAKYALDISWGHSGLPLVMSQRTWGKISDQDRKIILAAGKEAQLSVYRMAEESTEKGKQAFVKNGGEIVVPTENEIALWNEKFKLIWNKWISDNEASGVKDAKAILSDWHKAAKKSWGK